MYRYLVIVLLCLGGVAAFAATTTVTLNGKTVTVPVVEVNGKAFIDAVALMKLLGGSAYYSATAHKLVLSTTPAPPSGGSSSAAASGTPQLPGPDGSFGAIYAMGKTNPLYFSLKSAEYTTVPLVIGDSIYAPTADEKLLVLHFTVQNPQKEDLFVRYDSLKMTGVDAADVNHEGIEDWGDADSHKSVSLNLKPAQRLSVYTALKVPAKGIVPKLIIQPGDGPVLRFDLHGKVTGIPAPIADPSDTTGATALTTVPAQLNTAYPGANFSFRVEKFDYTSNALQGDAPEDGARYLVATMMIKNLSPRPAFLRYDTLAPELTTVGGEECKYHDMLFATSDTAFSQDEKPGQELRLRLYFTVPKGVVVKSLILKEGDCRSYEVEVK